MKLHSVWWQPNASTNSSDQREKVNFSVLTLLQHFPGISLNKLLPTKCEAKQYNFVLQIVTNQRNYVDVDKWAYYWAMYKILAPIDLHKIRN